MTHRERTILLDFIGDARVWIVTIAVLLFMWWWI